MTRKIRHVDAFTATPLEGNPAAVVDGEGLSPETMQRIALNQHLSETVFLLPPETEDAHARLRIFTPAVEIPFAGHPTLSAAHIIISEGRVRLRDGEALRLETGAGVIPVAVTAGDPPLYTMTQATPQFTEQPFPLDEIAASIGLAAGDVVRAEYVSTGLRWLIAQLVSLDVMLRVRPNFHEIAACKMDISIFCMGAQSPDAQVHVRAFAPSSGVDEDPVTGSSNGCIAAFIARHGLLPPRDGAIRYVAEQGIELGQPGRVYAAVTAPGGERLRGTVLPEQMEVHIGGHAVTVLRGELLLPDAT
jgi:PhzF family phenazine biosynthesis protein